MDPEYFCDNLIIKQAEEVMSGLYKNAYKVGSKYWEAIYNYWWVNII